MAISTVVVHRTVNPWVVGSNPTLPANLWGMGLLGVVVSFANLFQIGSNPIFSTNLFLIIQFEGDFI
jgi:hypothetical protein